MNFKTTALLFGVLITMLLVFGIAVQAPPNPAEKGTLFPAIAEKPSLDVGTVLLRKKDKQIRLVKTDTGWKLELPPATQTARADESKVDQIIDQVRRARASEETTVTSNLGKIGLDPPALQVTLKEKGAGREWTLYVGDRSPDKQFVYVATADRPREVVAVSESSLDSVLFDNPDELRSRTLLDVSEANARSLALAEPAGKDKKRSEVALAFTDTARWVFQKPAQYGPADFAGAPAPKEEPGVKGLLTALGGLRVENVSDFEPLGARPLSDYGLAEGQETLRVEVEHSGGLFGADKDKKVKEVLLVGGKFKDEYYVRLEQDQAVARVPAKKLETAFRVARRPETLRSRDLVPLERNEVDAIDVHSGVGLKTRVELRKAHATLWKLFTEGQSYKANETAVAGDRDSLWSALKGQGKVEEFFDAAGEVEAKKLDAQLGLDQPAAEVKLYAHAVQEKKEDKKADKGKEERDEPVLKKDARPAVTLVFGKADKGRVYVKRLGEGLPVNRLAVPAELLDKIAPPEGALALLDPALPTFPVEDVVKLELDRGPDGRFVVEKTPLKETGKDKAKEKEKQSDKAPAWQLVEPKDLPGRGGANEGQVREILEALAHLRVEKWVKKVDPKAAKGALAEYGLATPAVRATVTVKKGDGKPEAFAFTFGKEAGDDKGKGVYALQDKKPIVFLAQPVAVKVLRDAELRDRTVFQFDPAKVKEVLMAGWYETAKYQFELLLERKSAGTWEAPKLKGFELSSKLVNDFVRDLSHLQAKQFVLFKGKAPAEYKLDPADRNLRIDVKLEDGKTAYTLTLGALNKEKAGYYASASTLPGVVFLLPQHEFESVVASYNYFTRGKQAAR